MQAAGGYHRPKNETLFDSRKFRKMGDMGRLMEDQFLSLLSYVADQERSAKRFFISA